MKKLNSIWVFAGGAALGIGLTLCVGAADNAAKPEAAKTEKPAPPTVQMVTYPSGVTGFFDPASGRIYLYDVDMKKCFQVRQITTLGQPLGQP